MIYKRATSDPNWVEVIFELPASIWADHVTLAGDFNHWDQHSLPLHQDRDGCWRLQLVLPIARRYQFLYLIDGRWCGDCSDCRTVGAMGAVRNPFGSFNCVLDTSLGRGRDGEIES